MLELISMPHLSCGTLAARKWLITYGTVQYYRRVKTIVLYLNLSGIFKLINVRKMNLAYLRHMVVISYKRRMSIISKEIFNNTQ